MTHSYDGFNFLIRLETGERLMAALEQFANDKKLTVPGAWISGLGGASEATLGYYDLASKEFHWQTFSQLMEVTSLTGNLANDDQGKLVIHLHGVLTGDNFQAIGGHIKDLVVGATMELFVYRAYKPTNRKFDDITGLQLLDLG